MDHFLRGFVDELTKTAFVSSPKPAGTPTPAAPKPVSTGGGMSPGYKPRASLAPSNKPFSIPKQRMESPAGPPKPGRFRPSPSPRTIRGYAPEKEAPKKKVGRPKPKKVGTARDIVPWETAAQRAGRLMREKSHNMGRAKAKQQGGRFIRDEVVEILREGHRVGGVRMAQGQRLTAGHVVNCAGPLMPDCSPA